LFSLFGSPANPASQRLKITFHPEHQLFILIFTSSMAALIQDA
jgi:hypothetical protein